MSLEKILRRIKKAAVVVSIPAVVMTGGSIDAQSRSKVTNTYRVNAERLDLGQFSISDISNFASSKYSVTMLGDEYTVTGEMRGLNNLYHSRMNFRVNGHLDNNHYMPSHYEMKFDDNSAMSHDGLTVTVIDFDYVNNRANAYSYNVKDNVRHNLYSHNNIVIDNTVKDMISGIMDLRASDLNSSMNINTIISGRRKTYRVNFAGNESVSIHGANIQCGKFNMSIPANVIDTNPYRFTFWISRSNSRTPLKMNIRPGRSSLMAWHSGTVRE